MISSFATHTEFEQQRLCSPQESLSNSNSIDTNTHKCATETHTSLKNASTTNVDTNASTSSFYRRMTSYFYLTDSTKATSQFIHVRKIGILQLIGIAFFTTAGGPYGLEVCVQTGGVIVTIIGLIIMPIIYATPQALMTAELSNMMPENGGYVIWVFRAFGDFLGYVNAYNAIICNLFDNAIYPTLIMEYYHILYPQHIHGTIVFFLKELIVILGCIVNIQSIRKVGNLGVYTTLIILLPFTLGFIMVLPSINWHDMTAGPINHDGTVESLTWDNLRPKMALFLSTLFWCHTGWDGLGNFAGEVINPQKTYPIGVGIAILINLFNFLTAIIASMVPSFRDSDIKQENIWDEGYFAIAYREIWWPLGLGVAFSNTICQIVIYFNAIASTSRILAVMGDNVLSQGDEEETISASSVRARIEKSAGIESARMLRDDSDDVEGDTVDSQIAGPERRSRSRVPAHAESPQRHLRLLPKIFGKIDNRTHSPIVAIVCQTVIIAGLMGYGFAALVEVSVTLNCITLVIEFAAFLYLRYKEPNAPRPYIIPGGKPVAWLITVVKITLVVTVIVLTMLQLGLVFWITVGCNVSIVIIFVVRKLFIDKENLCEF